MPLIADRPNTKKRFKPRTFRPWDLPTITPNNDESQQVKDKSGNQTVNKETKNNPQIGSQLCNKLQVDNKTVNKQVTNGQQTVNKQVTNGQQTVNKRLTKQVTNRLTNGQQTVNKRLTNDDDYRHKIWSLIGNEKLIIDSMFLLCVGNGTLTTPPLNLQNISEHTNISNHGIIKTSIFSLTRKEIIKRTSAKTGRGGWSQYTFSTSIYQTLYSAKNNKWLTNGQQTVNKRLTKQVTQRVTIPPSSSSSSLNTISTTTRLSEKFSLVQIPSVLKENNLSANIIKQIQDRDYLSADELQESLDAFAFDVTTNNVLVKKKVNNAVAYFMGIVKHKTVYASPSNFESDTDKALTEQKSRLDALKKKREEASKIKNELAFEEWLLNLSDQTKLKIKPEHGIFKLGTAIHDLELKEYYEYMIKGEAALIY